MASSTTSSHSTDAHSEQKPAEKHIENVKTNERIPGQPNYYEKDGLRTYGDDEDHEHEPKVLNTIFLPAVARSSCGLKQPTFRTFRRS